jgi:predicted nuclease of predicted toxin-antitoxin system
VWVDAQLPPVLARWLAGEYGLDAAHVNEIGYVAADDAEIFASARGGGAAVVVTKDEDFVRLLERNGPPPQIVWVTCGNVRNAALRAIVLPVWPQVAALLASGWARRPTAFSRCGETMRNDMHRGARRTATAAVLVLVSAACSDRLDTAATSMRQLSIADSIAGEGGTRHAGQCARALSDPSTGVRLSLRGWDQRRHSTHVGNKKWSESYQHGYYSPADARAVGLAPGQEWEVDCRTFRAVGINTPDVR